MARAHRGMSVTSLATVIAQYCESLKFRGRGDQQVNGARRAVLSRLGEQLLNFLGALPGLFTHRHPSESSRNKRSFSS